MSPPGEHRPQHRQDVAECKVWHCGATRCGETRNLSKIIRVLKRPPPVAVAISVRDPAAAITLGGNAHTQILAEASLSQLLGRGPRVFGIRHLTRSVEFPVCIGSRQN